MPIEEPLVVAVGFLVTGVCLGGIGTDEVEEEVLVRTEDLGFYEEGGRAVSNFFSF